MILRFCLLLQRVLREGLARKKTDLRFTSITSSQSASVKSTASARRIVPALLTRMSARPSAFSVVRHDVRDRLHGGEVGADVMEAAAGGLHPRFGLGRRRAADGGDVGAGLGQRDRDALADAGVGAGDDGDFAGKIEGRAHFSWQISSSFMSV